MHVSYFQEVLTGIAEGESFDKLRVRIRQVSNDLSRRIGNSPASSRVADEFTLWSPTADAISELMRLGLVERHPLPSRRVHVDAHRETTYALSQLGQKVIKDAGGNDAALRNEMTPLLIKQHLYLSSLCKILSEEPLLIPEYTEEETKGFRQENGLAYERLGADAAERMRKAMSRADVSAHDVMEQVRLALERRFPPGVESTLKAVLDTTNDAIIVAALEARGLRYDAITFNVLASWGRQLFIFDESRYVHGMPGRAIWATADIAITDECEVSVGRRGLSAYGDRVSEELATSYRDLANSISEDLGGHAVKHPYIEIFKVRALTAFHVGVNTALVDRVIAEIGTGERQTPFDIELQLGTSSWPSSEPAFRLGDRRYYVMLIKSKGES